MDRNKNAWRVVLLALLSVAILGPWAFDRINVPAQYPCTPPNVRLEGDFCGMPVSGTWFIYGTVTEFIRQGMELVSGARALSRVGPVFGASVFLVLLLLPYVSSLYAILRESRGRQIISVAAWGLAAGACLLLGLMIYPQIYWALWGIWAYAGVAVSALILEIIYLIHLGRSPRRMQI